MNQTNISHNLLRLPAVRKKTGKPRSSLYLMIANGEFPKPIKLGKRSVAWIESEVDQWIELRIKQSRPKEMVNHE